MTTGKQVPVASSVNSVNTQKMSAPPPPFPPQTPQQMQMQQVQPPMAMVPQMFQPMQQQQQVFVPMPPIPVTQFNTVAVGSCVMVRCDDGKVSVSIRLRLCLGLRRKLSTSSLFQSHQAVVTGLSDHGSIRILFPLWQMEHVINMEAVESVLAPMQIL